MWKNKKIKKIHLDNGNYNLSFNDNLSNYSLNFANFDK